MKKIAKIVVIVLVISLPAVSPSKAHASGAVVAAAQAALIASDWLRHGIEIVQMGFTAYETAQTAINTYKMLESMLKSEKAALDNLKSVLGIRSFEDFMSWSNRQAYLARESEQIYNRMGVSVGGTRYQMNQIDQIPGALANHYRDPFDNSMTEEQKRQVFIQLGMTPGNYTYMQTWKGRNDEIARRIMTYDEIFAEEHEEAAKRNNEILEKYSTEGNESTDKEVALESLVVQMNLEMAIREQTRLMIETHRYQLSRDRMAETPPSAQTKSALWEKNPFGSIVPNSHVVNSFQGW